MLHFDNNIVSQTLYQKYLGIFLDAQFTFEEHLKVITTRVNKTIGPLRKLRKYLQRPVLMTIYKAFVRPHLVYDDVIYDEAYNTTFHQKLESNQYNAWLALLRAIRGLPREKRYQELGLESLQRQCWCSCLFYKIFKENKPVCLSNLIPTKKANYNTTKADKITLFPTKYNYFKNYFLKIYIFFSIHCY